MKLREPFLRKSYLSTFIHINKHMDGAWGTFWIKSLNGTFIVLQMKAFGPKKIQISSTGKKVPFWQFFRMGSNCMLGRPSRIPHRNWKILFVLGSYESLERLKGKIREAPFFKVQPGKKTVWKIVACYCKIYEGSLSFGQII